MLSKLGDFSLCGGVLLQQLLGAERDGQQPRLVQDLSCVEETTLACGCAVWSRMIWTVS